MFPGGRCFPAFALVALISFCTPLFHAQTESASPQRPLVAREPGRGTVVSEDVLVLDNWRVHPGDDAQWAAPGFDDSGWMSSGTPAREPGRNTYSGYRWYRATVDLPESLRGRDLGIGIGPLDEVYDVYAEGVSVGRFGDWQPRPQSPFNRNLCFRIPAGLIPRSNVHIAIRRWNAGSNTGLFTFYTSGASRFDHPIEIGPYSTMQSRTELYTASGIVKNLPSNLSLLASLLAGCIAFVLYSAQRHRIEYLLLGIYCSGAALVPFAGNILAADPNVMRRSAGPVLAVLFAAVVQASSILFLAEVCPSFRRWLQLGAAIEFLIFAMAAYATAASSSTADALFWTFTFYPSLITTILAAVGLFQQKNRGSLAIALALLSREIAETWSSAGSRLFHMNDLRFMPLGPFIFDMRNIVQVAMITVILIVLYQRYREEQARAVGLEQDMASARRMQEQMLGGNLLHTPGYAIEAVYRPAKEVGGDFYRIVPLKDGSLLVLVGDVSGKGLDASMLVAAVMGSLANETERSPASLLKYLNQAVIGKTAGGFITVCCAKIFPDGRMVVANAGHISPYLGSKELAAEPELPLGVSADATYNESFFQLAPGEQLTLLSDGVVEARNQAGSLFGFEATAVLCTQSAEAIAEAAANFGQDDDITVLTLSRVVA